MKYLRYSKPSFEMTYLFYSFSFHPSWLLQLNLPLLIQNVKMQVSRIDFLFYKGKGIRTIASKIVKTTPEIDDVWASDHAAVLTSFEVDPLSR